VAAWAFLCSKKLQVALLVPLVVELVVEVVAQLEEHHQHLLQSSLVVARDVVEEPRVAGVVAAVGHCWEPQVVV